MIFQLLAAIFQFLILKKFLAYNWNVEVLQKTLDFFDFGMRLTEAACNPNLKAPNLNPGPTQPL